jgi:hypothetical protein
VKPSVLRQAQIASATVWPHSIPRAMDSLFAAAASLAMAASEAASFSSNVLFWAG